MFLQSLSLTNNMNNNNNKQSNKQLESTELILGLSAYELLDLEETTEKKKRMQKQSWRLFMIACHPHFHRSNCAICNEAKNELQEKEKMLNSFNTCIISEKPVVFTKVVNECENNIPFNIDCKPTTTTITHPESIFFTQAAQSTKREMWECAFVRWVELLQQMKSDQTKTKTYEKSVELYEFPRVDIRNYAKNVTVFNSGNTQDDNQHTHQEQLKIKQSEGINITEPEDTYVEIKESNYNKSINNNSNTITKFDSKLEVKEACATFKENTSEFVPHETGKSNDRTSNYNTKEKLVFIPSKLHIPIHYNHERIERIALNNDDNTTTSTLIEECQSENSISDTYEKCKTDDYIYSNHHHHHNNNNYSSNNNNGDPFLTKIKSAGLTYQELEKQLHFQQALLDLKNIMESTLRIRFFLACGTALAAHREGYFIKHDDDIDVGIFYADIVDYGKQLGVTALQTDKRHTNKTCDADVQINSSNNSNSNNSNKHKTEPVSTYSDECTKHAEHALYIMINALVGKGTFVIFDICGTVSKGLEVRLLHRKTNTKIDINFYYPPLKESSMLSSNDCDKVIKDSEQSSNDNNIDKYNVICKYCTNREYVWCATYYENAHNRKHKMYRYKHTCFANKLIRLQFCDKELTSYCSFDKFNVLPVSCGFWVPPISYLIENYGKDWQILRIITYHDGVQGQYPNLIEE